MSKEAVKSVVIDAKFYEIERDVEIDISGNNMTLGVKQEGLLIDRSE